MERDITMNRDSYNKIADEWDEYRSKSPMNQVIKDFVLLLKTKGKVLDIGCGTGYPISSYLSHQGFVVTGFDISENMIAKAIALQLPKAEFIVSDFFDFKTKEKFDGVIAFDSLFHLPKERQTEVYGIISSWMNIGGYLLFTHGKNEGEVYGNMYDESFYYSALDLDYIKELLVISGFEIVSCLEDYYEETTGSRDLIITAKKVK